jgi:hypothetical protein
VRHFQIFIVLPSLSDVSAELQEEPLYKNDTGTTNIVNSQMDVYLVILNHMASTNHLIGEICVAKCEAENGQIIIIFSCYLYLT